ncbi:hypothetical protein KZ843_06810 [Pseudomonas aeruginosa]|nr:hypothetical protein [Pseudomonas aeruginosa]MBW6122603.1 hypothetical protein [Pseudomonas aeruginosa]
MLAVQGRPLGRLFSLPKTMPPIEMEKPSIPSVQVSSAFARTILAMELDLGEWDVCPLRETEKDLSILGIGHAFKLPGIGIEGAVHAINPWGDFHFNLIVR